MLPRMSKKDGFTRHPYDVEMGTQTSGLIPGRLLKTGHAHDRHSTAYFGVAPSVFRALLKRWLRSKPMAPVEEFTFIDVGAGMGRAMLLAAELPFRKLVGIELNPSLAEVARRNLKVLEADETRLASAKIICGDAVAASFPKGPCLAFLFNPFGEAVMRRLYKARIAAVFLHNAQAFEVDLLHYAKQRTRANHRTPAGIHTALSWPNSPIACRRHCRSHNHGQPA